MPDFCNFSRSNSFFSQWFLFKYWCHLISLILSSTQPRSNFVTPPPLPTYLYSILDLSPVFIARKRERERDRERERERERGTGICKTFLYSLPDFLRGYCWQQPLSVCLCVCVYALYILFHLFVCVFFVVHSNPGFMLIYRESWLLHFPLFIFFRSVSLFRPSKQALCVSRCLSVCLSFLQVSLQSTLGCISLCLVVLPVSAMAVCVFLLCLSILFSSKYLALSF